MSKVKGRFTFRTAAVLFLISAAFEVLALNAAVPLFGEVRGGWVAAIHHLVYGAVFSAAGVGLWRAKRFGYTAVMVGTGLYTLDRGLLLLDHQTLQEYLASQFARYGDVAQILDLESVMALTMLMSVMFIAGWWGFAIYTHWRRAYFEPESAAEKPGSE